MRTRSLALDRAVAGLALVSIGLGLGSLSCKSMSGASGSGGAPALTRAEGPPGRVVLVAIDGLTADAYRAAAAARSHMPVLSSLARAGVAADELVPVTPAATYPAYASLVTGRRPDRHGIASDRLLGERGVRDARYWHSSRLQAPVLWDRAAGDGLQTVALGWPTSLGANIEWLVPDADPERAGESWLDVQQSAATPALFGALRAAAEGASPTWPDADQRDELMVDLACEIAGDPEPPELWLVRLKASGDAVRRSGVGSADAQAAFMRADARLGRLLGCLERAELLSSSAIVVVGDRSLAPVHTRVDPNVALVRAGLIEVEGAQATRWAALARSNGGSAFVYAKEAEAAVAARDALAAVAERTGAFRVVSARELQALHADPQAWFGIEAEPGFVFGDGIAEPILRPAARRAESGYLMPPGLGAVGFVAWGAGLRSGLRVPRLAQIDVAPTVAALLGTSFEGVDGHIAIGLLERDNREGRP